MGGLLRARQVACGRPRLLQSGICGGEEPGAHGMPALPALPAFPRPIATLPPPSLCCLVHQAWYTEEDVRLGVVLELHGRRFRLVRADAFTEQYLASNGGSA